jgi:DNA-binding transcriptional ArsR family regulator
MSPKRAAETVDDVLGALADPTRRALFEATLRTPGLTTTQLSDRVAHMSRWGVIKHMAVLRDVGLIQTMATGRLRRHYAETAALSPLRQWLDAIRDS